MRMSIILGAYVADIYIADGKNKPMRQVTKTLALANLGLNEDHHAGKDPSRQVTLIAEDGIKTANRNAPIPFLASETRRNIVIGGIGLNGFNALIGCTIRIGEAELFCTGPCDPCDLPSRLSGKPGFKKAFSGYAGITARVIRTGAIAVGDNLESDMGPEYDLYCNKK